MAKEKTIEVKVSAPNIQQLAYLIRGTAPLMTARFSEKARNMMAAKMAKGSQARKEKPIREARDFQADAEAAAYVSETGWHGVPASMFRNACIRACSIVGIKMTEAKMSVFVIPDGFDARDGTPLVRLIAEKPETDIRPVRNQTGVADLRARPMWREWSARVTLAFDADQFDAVSATNLLMRAGLQVGIGEGRPFSNKTGGIGFGTFTVEGSPTSKG